MTRQALLAARTIAAAALVVAAALSCPNAIDEELLLVVDDAIAPSITITAPAQNGTYRYSLQVVGTLGDSSRTFGDGAGFVRTLRFSVSNDATLDRVVTFERDGSWTVTPPDPTFAYTPATGAFTFTVNTSMLSNMRYFLFTVEDLNGNHGDLVVTILPDPALNAGPEIRIADATHLCPSLYSSSSTTAVTMRGWVDPAQYQAGTASFVVEPNSGVPRPETPITPEEDGEFSFWFDPQATPRLSTNLTVRIYARDHAGRLSQATHAIYDDPVFPLGSFTVAADVVYANATTTLLSIGIYDYHSGMDAMRFRNDAEPWVETDWVAFASGSQPWTLVSTDGLRTVRAEFRDRAGNVIARSDTIFLDTVAPTVSNFRIDSGASYTRDTSVDLSLAATDPAPKSDLSEMRFSRDQVTWSDWEPYGASHAGFDLTGGDGQRFVYAEISDNAGNIRAASDDIVLDREGPSGTLVINDGDAWTGNRRVTLTITANDTVSGMYRMRLRNDSLAGSWTAFYATLPWDLANDDDARTVWLDLEDHAGNITTNAASDTIGLDRSDPEISSFEINNDDDSTTSLDVTLTISATDAPTGTPYQMQFSNDGGATWFGAQAYASSTAWNLGGDPATFGSRMVVIKITDRGGNHVTSHDSIDYVSP